MQTANRFSFKIEAGHVAKYSLKQSRKHMQNLCLFHYRSLSTLLTLKVSAGSHSYERAAGQIPNRREANVPISTALNSYGCLSTIANLFHRYMYSLII